MKLFHIKFPSIFNYNHSLCLTNLRWNVDTIPTYFMNEIIHFFIDIPIVWLAKCGHILSAIKRSVVWRGMLELACTRLSGLEFFSSLSNSVQWCNFYGSNSSTVKISTPKKLVKATNQGFLCFLRDSLVAHHWVTPLWIKFGSETALTNSFGRSNVTSVSGPSSLHISLHFLPLNIFSWKMPNHSRKKPTHTRTELPSS